LCILTKLSLNENDFIGKIVYLCYNTFLKLKKGVKMKNERRKFLKKMAYSAPVVASLGLLVEPSKASAFPWQRDGRHCSKNVKSKISRCKNHIRDKMEFGH
jgi:hypothetical protein